MGVEAILPTCAPGVDQQCDKHEMTVTAVAVGTNPFASWPVLLFGFGCWMSVLTGRGKAE